MSGFMNDLLHRNTRRQDNPDTINRARSLRELAIADGRAWMIAWLFGRPA